MHPWGIPVTSVILLGVFVLVIALYGYCDPNTYAGNKDAYHYTGHGDGTIPTGATPLIRIAGISRQDITKTDWAYVSYDGTDTSLAEPCTNGSKHAKIKIRGHSPRYPYPTSYKIKYYVCENGQYEKDKEGRPTNYYTLRIGFLDETTLRDNLGQWIWHRIGMDTTDAMSCTPTYLAINNEFLGAYQHCTSPTKHVITDYSDDDVLFKLDGASDSEWPQITQHEIKEPEPGDVENVEEYAEYLKGVVSLYHSNQIENIDVESHARRFVFQELSHDTDGSNATQTFAYPMVWDYDLAFASPQQLCVLPPTARTDGFEYSSWARESWQTTMTKHDAVRDRIDEILRTLNLELDAFDFDMFNPKYMRLDYHEWLHSTCYPYLFDGVDKATYDLFSPDGLHYEPLLRDKGGHLAYKLPQTHAEAVDGLREYIVGREAALRKCQLDTCGDLDRKGWGPLFIMLMVLIGLVIATFGYVTTRLCIVRRKRIADEQLNEPLLTTNG